MERITAKEVQSMMEAYASVYKTEEQETLSEGYGKDCVKKEKKTKHNCAKKVCHEEFGQGETIFGQHAEPDENGFVSHYDVQFEHGIVENVSVEDLEVLTLVEHGGHGKKKTMYAHTEVEGEPILENIVPNRGAYDKLTKAQQDGAAKRKELEDQIYRDGGGDAKVKEFQAKGYTLGQARRATMNQGRTNQRNAKSSSQSTTSETPKTKEPSATQKEVDKDKKMYGDTVPQGSFNISPKGSDRRKEVEDQIKRDNAARTDDERVQPKPAPKPNPNVTKDGTKFERRLPTMAELRAAQAARRAAPKVLSRAEIENRAVKAGVGEGQRKPPTAPPPVSSTKPAVTPAAKPAVTAAGNKVSDLAALRAKAKEDIMKKKSAASAPAMSGRARMREELDVFDTIKEHLILEHELSEDVAIQVMTLLDEETRGEIMEYTAAIRADADKRPIVKMTATGKEPVGDRLLKGIGKKIGGFLNRLNPNALKSTTVEPRKPLVQHNNSFELEGELVDEGSCGSKKKKKSKKGGY